MMKYLFSLAISVGMALSMFAAAPQPRGAGPGNVPQRLDGSDITGNHIAFMWAVYCDWEEMGYYDCQSYAPCVTVTGNGGSYVIPEFYAGLPLSFDVDWDTRDARIPWAVLLLNDTIHGTTTGSAWTQKNRTDTVRRVVCMSSDYFITGNESDLMGTVRDDGTVVFSFDYDYENDFQNGFVFFKEEVYLTYNRRGLLMATDTAFMASPVISYLELLVPNGRHDFEQVFYTEGTNPIVEPEPDDPDPDSDNPDESDIPKIVPGQSLDFVDLIIGGGQTCEPDGVGKGHWGGGIKPIVGPPVIPIGDLSVLDGDGWHSKPNLDGSGFSTFNSGRLPISLRKHFQKISRGTFDNTTGFGPGGGGPIKPGDLSFKRLPDGTLPGGGDNSGLVFSVSNPGDEGDSGEGGIISGDLTPLIKPIKVYVSTEIYISQAFFGESGRTVYIYNLFGNGRVSVFYVKEDGTFDFPFQVIGYDNNADAWAYNYTTPTWNINELTEGNTGTATSDALNWGITVPHESNAPTGDGDNGGSGSNSNNNDMLSSSGKIDLFDGGKWQPSDLVCLLPYFYQNNHLSFTDGSCFVLTEPEVLNISTVTRKIDAALCGKGSIADVTETIDKLLKSAPDK